MTLLSRITGLARESLKATAFGAGLQMDAFEAAFRLPNLLRRLFAEGAFSQAFVPILAEYRRQRGVDATRALVGSVGTLLASCCSCVSVVGVARGAVARLRARRRIRAHARQGRADGRDDPHRLPVHPVRVAGLARRRRAQRLPALRDSRVHAGAAQPVDHRRGDLSRALSSIRRSWRSRGACAIGGVAQLALQIRPLLRDRHAAAPALRLARRRRAPRAARDGARGDRRVGRADLGADQHAARGAARRRPHLVDHVRRPADGVSERAARRGARHGPAAVARAASQRRESRRVFGAARLGIAPRVPARAAGGRGAVRCSRCRSSSTLYQYGRFTVERRACRRAPRCSATASACPR